MRLSLIYNECDKKHERRIVDFLSGTVYALGGEIQKVGTNIILCTPDNVEVQEIFRICLQSENLTIRGGNN